MKLHITTYLYKTIYEHIGRSSASLRSRYNFTVLSLRRTRINYPKIIDNAATINKQTITK